MDSKNEYLAKKARLIKDIRDRNTPDEILDFYVTQLFDTTDDERDIEQFGRKLLGDEFVDGDSYCVPSPVDIVEAIATLCEQQEKEIERLKEYEWMYKDLCD